MSKLARTIEAMIRLEKLNVGVLLFPSEIPDLLSALADYGWYYQYTKTNEQLKVGKTKFSFYGFKNSNRLRGPQHDAVIESGEAPEEIKDMAKFTLRLSEYPIYIQV